MLNIPFDPKLQKDLAEEHQREILEDVEAERLAHDEVPAKETEEPSEDYQPVTDEKAHSIIPIAKIVTFMVMNNRSGHDHS